MNHIDGSVAKAAYEAVGGLPEEPKGWMQKWEAMDTQMQAQMLDDCEFFKNGRANCSARVGSTRGGHFQRQASHKEDSAVGDGPTVEGKNGNGGQHYAQQVRDIELDCSAVGPGNDGLEN